MAIDIQTLNEYIARHDTRTCQHIEHTRLSQRHWGHASDKTLADMRSAMNVSPYRLFNRSVRVESMTYMYMYACKSGGNNRIKLALKDINIIQLQPFKAFLDRIKYVLPTQAMLIDISLSIWICYDTGFLMWIVSNDRENFGHNDNFISGKL